MANLDSLKEKVKLVPDQPGCYLWKGDSDVGRESENKRSRDRILYVGKAKNLRARVRQYLISEDYKTHFLMNRVKALDWVVTQNELEALLLENNLIKEHNPPFNIKLKDDKRYPYLCLTMSEPFPRLILTRRKSNANNLYFGPFSNTGAARATMSLIKKVFPIRKRGLKLPLKTPAKPCLNFHIGRCWAPCTGKIKKNEYRDMVLEVSNFLRGETKEVQENLTKKMQTASDDLNYERAAQLRNILHDLENTVLNAQGVHTEDDEKNYDILGVYVTDSATLYKSFESEGLEIETLLKKPFIGQLVLIQIRKGNMISKKSFGLDINIAAEKIESEFLNVFLRDYYSQVIDLPSSIVTNVEIEQKESWQELLSKRKPIELIDKRNSRAIKEHQGLLKMAQENAKLSIRENILLNHTKNKQLGLKQIKNFLGLSTIPKDIECYDISNIQGKQAVASGVHFRDGLPHKPRYRKYKINSLDEPNDPAMMAEVISRRLRRVIDDPKSKPDLIVVDGGITQLRAAMGVKAELNVSMPIVGLAKREEELYLESGEVLNLDNDIPGMMILIALRNEAHRFAVNYHRTLRMKRNLTSWLDGIETIGEERKKELSAALRKVDLTTMSKPEVINYLRSNTKVPMAQLEKVVAKI